MKTKKIISDIDTNILIHTFGEDGSFNLISYNDLQPSDQVIINNYNELFDRLRRQSKPVLEEPSELGEPIYVMMTPCPVNPDLIVKVYDTDYRNDKNAQIITITIRAIHYSSAGIRVPEWDCDDFVIADMSEEKQVDVTPDGQVAVETVLTGVVRLEVSGYVLIDGEIFTRIYEPSYTLANTMLQNNVPLPSLIQTAIHIADIDGTLGKRLYGI